MQNKILIVIASLTLVGCATTHEFTPDGVTPVRIPDLPAGLSIKANQMPQIESNSMGAHVSAGVDADIAYNDVAFKYNHLIDLYNCVKQSINNKTDLKECLDGPTESTR